MEKNISAIRLLRVALLLVFSFCMFFTSNIAFLIKCAWVLGYFALNVNDFFRMRYFKGKRLLYYFSFFITVLGAGCILKFTYNTAAIVYFIFPLVEIIIGDTHFPYIPVLVHFSVYLAAQYDQLRSQFFVLILVYCFVILIVYQFRINNLEKQKVIKLNKELQDANTKLQKYSENIKHISIMEERTRIAQELHDSIGHGLVALGMNLEFAENVMNKKPEKAMEAILRARGQSKSCMDDLRHAVTALKSDSTESLIGLLDSLNRLFDNVRSGGIQFHLSFDKRAEFTRPEIKDCIYDTVREAVTNGIRHGNANVFTVDIAYKGSSLNVSVMDNGCGCENIVESHGLTGMENRARALEGYVSYASAPQHGFEVHLEIPAGDRMEGKLYD